MMERCMCGDPYCGSCGDPSLAKWESAIDELVRLLIALKVNEPEMGFIMNTLPILIDEVRSCVKVALMEVRDA